jgi:gas vesicle protein
MRPHDHGDDPYVVIEKHSGSVGSFLIGLGVGAAVALLLAPQPGVETRRLVARRARDAGGAARERARGLADDMSIEVGGQLDRARTAVTSRVDRARDAVELKRQQVQRAVEAGRQAAQHAREDLERRIAETKAAYQAGAQVARDAGDRPAERAAAAAGAIAGATAGTAGGSASARGRSLGRGAAPGGFELAPEGAEDGDAV